MSEQTSKTRSTSYWARIIIPALVILLWLVTGALGGTMFGRVDEVAKNDQTAYLPERSDALAVQHLLGEFNGTDSIPAVVIYTSDAAIDQADAAAVASHLDAINIDGVSPTSMPIMPSEDGKALQSIVLVDSDAKVADVVSELSDYVQADVPEGMQAYVTGPAGFAAGIAQGLASIDGLLLVVALAAVLLILLVVYRSALLPIVVLSTSMFALCVALLVVWWLAKAEIVTLSGQTQGILFILVIGATTDYSLLYVARFREALRRTRNIREATTSAWKGALEPIVASGGTVIAGLLCLLLSDLKSNSTLGPVTAIGIVFAMIAALTLLPAALQLLGRAAFWPVIPKFEPEVVEAEHGMPTRGLWARIARTVQIRPRVIWVAVTLVLLIGSFGVLQLRAHGVPQSEMVTGENEARDGQIALGEHFPGGSGSPVYVVTEEGKLVEVAQKLLAHDGVDQLTAASSESPAGVVPVTEDGPAPLDPRMPDVPPLTVVDGQVLIQATLTDPADSDAASQTVRDITAELGDTAMVGGVTATSIATTDAAVHDSYLIIPVILGVIMLILMALLRSILAPILLIATTVLSFGTALGVSALVFNHVFGFSGSDPAVPLYAFVFLVALGIDYNIFLMTRVREEAKEHGTRSGILRGLVITGGVITSAGIVLASTFAALSVVPVLFLLQVAFIVAFGVLLDTFVVRSLLVPALGYDIGPAIWWPSPLAKKPDGALPVLDADAPDAAAAAEAPAAEAFTGAESSKTP
ncbi:MMPL family transporter [Gulosibacter bifidus]|uniref:MMPL family transporter n=1 Tax=Gulosibacter bifidus TaxID=272239 RepID=A0ABW5RL24_9MICO|nr:MMPL family transporter [Gulosibacter bifidus]